MMIVFRFDGGVEHTRFVRIGFYYQFRS